MGKGDRKSKKGKIWRGTTGKRHQNRSKKANIIIEKPPVKAKPKAQPKEETQAKAKPKVKKVKKEKES